MYQEFAKQREPEAQVSGGQRNSELIARITGYLTAGGLFNPEMAKHDNVSILLRDCREALAAQPDLASLQSRVKELVAKWRDQANAMEALFNGDPDCYNDAFDTLRPCADELEAALRGDKVGEKGDKQ